MSELKENKNIQTKVRDSSIELLRIILILMVIALHYNDGKAFVYTKDILVNRTFLNFIESICICAVDCFMIISGYFLVKSYNVKIIKPLELIIQVVVFKELFYLSTVILKNADFNIKSLLANLIPNNYFVILYAVVYLISPYINILLNKLDSKQLKKFVILMMLIFSVYAVIVDLFEEIIGQEITGLNSHGMYGTQNGFNIVNFILCYIIGAYLRLSDTSKIKKKQLYLISIVVIFVWSLLNEKIVSFGLRSAWEYCNPFVITEAVCLFLIFKDLNLKSNIINNLSKSTFTVFLFHGYLLGFANIEKYSIQPLPILMFHMLITVLCSYLICFAVFFIWNLCTKKIFSFLSTKLEKFNISVKEG